MDRKTLERLKYLLSTTGPDKWGHAPCCHEAPNGRHRLSICHMDGGMSDEEAAFIVLSREAMPELLAAYERLIFGVL